MAEREFYREDPPQYDAEYAVRVSRAEAVIVAPDGDEIAIVDRMYWADRIVEALNAQHRTK